MASEPRAAGPWAWWNNYSPIPLIQCIERAQQHPQPRGLIIKHGHPDALAAVLVARIPFAVERYVLPTQPLEEARLLANGIDNGAAFAVINAEHEWESPGAGDAMRTLLNELRRIHPRAELYASVDTRSGRNALPYQRALAEHVTGWMPMIYPLAFYPNRHPAYVRLAFADALDQGQAFGSKPILPTIQTYDNIGPDAVAAQVAEVHARRLTGCQAYTIGHATDAEWATFVKETSMATDNTKVTTAAVLRRLDCAHLFFRAAAHAMNGDKLPDLLLRQLKYILGGPTT